ncbi:flagellar hook-length control protein FliK [Clostridium gasigenes]|uniref:flagellar hook-length control protein FliK n=1 Tax=Clostridium gasigenes TaxID=94869 RepID=UPI001C0AE1B4|nr:flagellar hook-length control protein FliK [Clostridium gasigenes]MBU3132138.1 flagellar hook-length control protein FliK [Clostridium gasigenes]
MIDNKFSLNIPTKEPTQNTSKSNNVEKITTDNNFKKILNKKTEKPTNDENRSNNSLNKKEFINSNDVKVIEDSKVKETVKEVVEIISNEENFQGNKFEGQILEEVVALLNQILNSPEIKSLLPVKLEDPMLMQSSIAEVNNKEIPLLNNIDTQVDMEVIKNNNLTKEALNLTNTILDALNSKKIDGVLSTNQMQEFKTALEGLTENLFNKVDILPKTITKQGIETNEIKVAKQNSTVDISMVNTIDNEAKSEVESIVTNLKTVLGTEKIDDKSIVTKEFIDVKQISKIDISTNDTIESEVKSVLTDLKATLDPKRFSEVKDNGVVDKSLLEVEGLKTEVSKEDKLLAKILGGNENAGLNNQNTLINRLNVKSTEVIKEPMVVSKETMDTDIIKNVKFMMKNAVAELKVKIYPKELGEMTIKLLSEEGILKADIKAISKETYNLLNSNLNEIKKSLEQQNIKIHEVNIGLYSDDPTYHGGESNQDELFKNNQNKQGKNSSKQSGFFTEDLEDDEKLYDDSSVNLLV